MTDLHKQKQRGEYAKTGAKRVAILDAALEVFAQVGYGAGSLREVAARVGMSEAGLLHHFPTKPALLAAVLDRRDQHSQEWVRMAEGDGDVTLRGLITTAVRNASTPGIVELYCVLSAEATQPGHPARDYFIARYEEARTNLCMAFEDLARQNRTRPGVVPRSAAIATLAMMDGLQVQWLLHPEVVDMAAELADFLTAFVDIDLTISS